MSPPRTAIEQAMDRFSHYEPTDEEPAATSVQTIAESYADLKRVVLESFPSLWPITHAFLAATASLCWKDFPLPVTMIASGPSGSGKTEPLVWIMRAGLPCFERSDQFTPASFVTHAPTVKKEDLKKHDLLPRLKNRCLCTKELAPLFAGREDELRVSFAKLTSVLDGEGLVTSSATQGTRGYSEQINFTWLGATTPPSPRVFALMAALGTRLFFFSTDCQRPTVSDYAAIISGRKKQAGKREACQNALTRFLVSFFGILPARSLSFDAVTISDPISEAIALLCEALTRLRSGISIAEGVTDEEDRYGSPSTEHGWRAAQVLSALAKGSALIRGNRLVDEEDLALIRRVCLSSMPEYRRLTFEAILALGGKVTALAVANRARMAKKTALHYLKELTVLQLLDAETAIEPFEYFLREELQGLLPTPYSPPKSVTPNQGLEPQSAVELTIRNRSDQGVTENGGKHTCEAEGTGKILPENPNPDGEIVDAI